MLASMSSVEFEEDIESRTGETRCGDGVREHVAYPLSWSKDLFAPRRGLEVGVRYVPVRVGVRGRRGLEGWCTTEGQPRVEQFASSMFNTDIRSTLRCYYATKPRLAGHDIPGHWWHQRPTRPLLVQHIKKNLRELCTTVEQHTMAQSEKTTNVERWGGALTHGQR